MCGLYTTHLSQCLIPDVLIYRNRERFNERPNSALVLIGSDDRLLVSAIPQTRFRLQHDV